MSIFFFLNQDKLRDWESIERCKSLLKFCLDDTLKLKTEGLKILDCGSKDGQTIEWCSKHYKMDSVGIEIAPSYVKWANDKGRKTLNEDLCNLPDNWTETYDISFAHHVLGLTRDYFKALTEMFRVIKKGGYLITLNHCPGNKNKHYSYIESKKIYDKWLKSHELTPHKKIYYDYWGDLKNEFVIFLQKEGVNK